MNVCMVVKFHEISVIINFFPKAALVFRLFNLICFTIAVSLYAILLIKNVVGT